MNFVAYYRVSTDKQGKSGLGLEAQQEAVRQFVGESGKVIAVYTEIESGRNNERTKIALAVSHAKRAKARLVIAKLDRLSRDVYFTSGLMKSGVDFVACDNPNANKLTIHILAAVAEDEAERISQRTTVALAALKARGVQLGSSREGHWEGECTDRPGVSRKDARLAGLAKGRAAGTATLKRLAFEAVSDILPRMVEMRTAGMTLANIASTLNEEGQTTRQGAKWSPAHVHFALKRAAK